MCSAPCRSIRLERSCTGAGNYLAMILGIGQEMIHGNREASVLRTVILIEVRIILKLIPEVLKLVIVCEQEY